MKTTNRVLLRWSSFLLLFVSCTAGIPEVPFPERNPPTDEGVQLGRRLFYDPILSRDSTISCSTCHIQSLAFSDGQQTSTSGITGNPLTRHSPSLTNTGYQSHFFWDGGSPDLESQVFLPLTHEDEMGSDLAMLVVRLQNSAVYPELFERAFGTDSIVVAHVARALAQFQRTLTSWDSKFDKVNSGELAFARLEEKGAKIFETRCTTCHPAPFFTDGGFHNNGLDTVFSKEDELIYTGRFRITYDSADIGAFKTPTLRNIGVTAPYMHDGRFASLEEVIEHYRSPLLSETLDTSLQQGIDISSEEEEALIAFLHTLTDSTFVTRTDLGPIE